MISSVEGNLIQRQAEHFSTRGGGGGGGGGCGGVRGVWGVD